MRHARLAVVGGELERGYADRGYTPDIARGDAGRFPWSQVHPVRWAADTRGPAVQDVGVDHGRADVGVTEQFLDGSDVAVLLQAVGGEGVARPW